MPPNTRKASKASKENDCVFKPNRVKPVVKSTKSSRKVLEDKTNSASDDNTSICIETDPKKSLKLAEIQSKPDILRSRRTRKIPSRYEENVLSPKLSNRDDFKDISKVANAKSPKKIKMPALVITPLKTSRSDLKNSHIKSRPKRICKLPSRFDDHSTSPNKFIPVQPISASTPLISNAKTGKQVNAKRSQKLYEQITKTKSNLHNAIQNSVKNGKQNTINNYFNNNSKENEQKNIISLSTAPKYNQSIIKKDVPKENMKRNLKKHSSKVDVYEFTYDPEEEPPPTKKKKKKVVKKAIKPKAVAVKSNYEKNLAKVLASLKNKVGSKTVPDLEGKSTVRQLDQRRKPIQVTEVQNELDNVVSNQNQSINSKSSIVADKNYNSVRVEDIAKDMEADDNNIDYSPVNSPSRHKTPFNENAEKTNDSLNIQDMSFFDEQPGASSSMNVSIRHPTASPWRVEFESLPIKWHVNAYVKPNMTPAVETSFINFNDSKKKHVYTNILPEANDTVPKIVESPNLKQTSIISFIKEVIERDSKKREKSRTTLVKANSLFEDTNTSNVAHSPMHQIEKSNENMAMANKVLVKNNASTTNNMHNINSVQQNEKSEQNNTYFGFDTSEDQENVSPKKKNKHRVLRARTRGILQELNEQQGPMRAIVPISAQSKHLRNSDGVNNLFNEVKSATEPPSFPDATVISNTDVTTTEPSIPIENVESQSFHLFEDIDVVHNHKPARKSYGKPKKVAFRKYSSDSDTDPLSDVGQALTDEDLDDLSFKLSLIKPKRTTKKKKTKKQKLSKKEEQEAEAWAAGFNSMCEDVDEFDLVVE